MRVALDSATGVGTNRVKRTVLGRLTKRLRRFGRDEDGSMIVFSLFLIIMMLIVGGMAVDLMRFETNRSRLAATLDRAILAAADLDQTLTPEQVVRDYFQKAGLLDQLRSVTVVETVNSRSVSARASINVNMMFMDLLGIEQLEAPAAGTARESVTDIEIQMVLDVSGSMNSNSRMVNLQAAARSFVATMLANDVNHRISIGIVPFNGQVNLGPLLLAKYNISDLNGTANSNCVDLPAPVYGAASMSRTLSMPQTVFADTYTGTTTSNAFYTVASNLPVASNIWCPQRAGNIVRLPSGDITTLQGYITGMSAVGATSINAGMKWGMALLDPTSRPMFSEFIGAGQISTDYANRPLNYPTSNSQTMKVIVLMTDGEHWPEERVNTGYRTGLSPIYRASDANFSIRHTAGFPVGAPFYVPHLGTWNWRAWNGTAAGTVPLQCANNNDLASDPDGKGVCVRIVAPVTQQTWPQVWSQMRMRYVAWQFYARPLPGLFSYVAQMDTFRSLTPAVTMDGQLQQMCGMAKTSGIVVFGIAFEAPANGQTQISSCSSSPSHYYVANGSQINTAFYSIANQIQSLRLMQ